MNVLHAESGSVRGSECLYQTKPINYLSFSVFLFVLSGTTTSKEPSYSSPTWMKFPSLIRPASVCDVSWHREMASLTIPATESSSWQKPGRRFPLCLYPHSPFIHLFLLSSFYLSGFKSLLPLSLFFAVCFWPSICPSVRLYVDYFDIVSEC